MSRLPRVAVFGSSKAGADSVPAGLAEALGRELARAGYAVLTGGYGGVMEAASKGAHGAGGEAIGVTSAVFADRKAGNPYLTGIRHTQTLPERLLTLISEADAFVVLDGGVGTLAELFLAWNLLVLGDTRPLVVVGEGMRAAVEGLLRHTELDDDLLAMLHFAGTEEEVCAVLRGCVPPGTESPD